MVRVRFILFHMAYYPEIKAGQEYILTKGEASFPKAWAA